ncbi:hypothetical protein DDB_G0284189 [Dictyostelium discoideum AX4]|uniref:Uncharacterized protein n=1 Tax=Dictyostelium discoideum TaxID=44689 RepID=Q54Q11_DICDI|nr:hypothetical protein DDB_G0284189 [Dictyostelium discoideum AX4]EAL65283.1 hypothetical protein DDB_G0284189 [Dictyostelium discoideum AX4]|eukprot:XP_638634.1 hypothetical protein DDB_G0284189 [Dictyostelium discoideum AX4]
MSTKPVSLTKEIIYKINNFLKDKDTFTPFKIKEKVYDNNISFTTIQDNYGYNINCLQGDNLCLKGASKNTIKISVYASFSDFWGHAYFLHYHLGHAPAHKILKILKELKLGFPKMNNDISNYLMIICPMCVHSNRKNFSSKNFDQNEYYKICECIGMDPALLIQPQIINPLNNVRGNEESMTFSFLTDPTPTAYLGEPTQIINVPPTYDYQIINREISDEIEPLIFKPIINNLKIFPADLNDIPMSASVPELFAEPYLHVFKSFPLYKSSTFVICIGRFKNIENENLPFYLIIAVDIDDIKNNDHILLNYRPLLQDQINGNFHLFAEFNHKEHSKKKLIEIVPFANL